MLDWLWRKAAPERQAFVPAWLTGEGEQGGFARGYQAQLDEVYRRNPVGLRAVRLVAGLVGGLPLFGDANAVALIKAEGLLERTAASLLLHGNAYARLVTDSSDRPAELHLMRPERVSVVTGVDGWPAAYLYRGGGQAVRVARNDALGRRQVAHLKALDPSDDHYGLGCLEAAIGGASVHNRASRWNKALLDNAARPSGALVYEPGDGSSLAAEQFDRLQKELGEQFSGSANAGRPLLLDGGLKWQALGLSPADMDFVAVKIRAVAGSAGLWRRVPAELALESGAPAALAIERRAVLGWAESVLDARAPLILDEVSSVIIRLVNPAHYLLNADDEALVAGANLAILGDELLQFGRAEQLGDGTYRLSKLLRGRRGTEWAALSHGVGDRFFLIDPTAMRIIDLPASAVGGSLSITGHGIGDNAPLPVAGRGVTGESLRPPSPCHVSLTRDGANVRAEWVRRSHRGWEWNDGVGVAEDPFPERYRLSFTGAGGELIAETATASAIVTVSELPGGPGEQVTLAVTTVGPAALSRPAFAFITL